MTEVWRIFTPGEPIRCECGRAQDIVAPLTTVRVRQQAVARNAEPSSLLRRCRACGACLEVNVAPTTQASADPSDLRRAADSAARTLTQSIRGSYGR